MFIFLLLQDANFQFIPLLVILFWSTLAISILPVCCKKSKKSSKTNKLANGNSAKASSDSKMNKRKKKSGKKEDKPKTENDKQKQTFSQVQKLKTTSKSTVGTCKPDNKTTTGEKKNVKEDEEDKSKEKKERKNSELKTAKSFKTCSKSELSMPSEDMMSKHEEIVEIVDVNFIISSKNLKPPKGQTSLSVFNQIRKNAAQHLMEDMSSLHAYDQVPLIDQMRMPKKGKGPKNELKINLYFSSI
ncbi:unnamed protein product [Meloidogyne enterolobii]|uniref:Uncharacterized protein n=1 Tax=Meloidogyne enterolobii TaxID=390850 RepID=A0ACB1AZ97_MELEN